MKGFECLRGIGALELNTQHCDETQRFMNGTGYAFNMNKKKAMNGLRSTESSYKTQDS